MLGFLKVLDLVLAPLPMLGVSLYTTRTYGYLCYPDLSHSMYSTLGHLNIPLSMS